MMMGIIEVVKTLVDKLGGKSDFYSRLPNSETLSSQNSFFHSVFFAWDFFFFFLDQRLTSQLSLSNASFTWPMGSFIKSVIHSTLVTDLSPLSCLIDHN